MSCERFSGAIIDHACGALIDDAAAAHLRECAACRQTFDEYRRLLTDSDAVLRSELSIVASPGFVVRVSARTRQLEAPVWAWVPARWWVGVAAAAAIAIGIYVRAPIERPAPESASRRESAPSVHLPAAPATAKAASSISGAPERNTDRKTQARVMAPDAGPARSTVPESPVVIVPPDQHRAIARLQELLRSGALDQIDVPPATETVELCIEPLSIRELAVPDLPPVGGQSATVSDKD